MEWIGDRSLVYLTLTNELTVVDTVMMTLMEKLDFSGIRLVYAEFALSRTSSPSQVSDKEKTDPHVSTTFQNSIRSSEDRLLVLCQEEVKTVSIMGIQQRVATLEQDGEWLEALALALDHYESTVKSQEDRRRDPHGRRDLMNHPEFLSKIRKAEDEEWIAELLLRYLNLAVENAPEATLDPVPARKLSTSRQVGSKIDLAQSHFQMLAGVCIEFCIVTRRLDILFNDVYECFRSSGYTAVFLDVLEPYVLNDKLQYIAPVVMAQFIEHCKVTNDVSTVERCLLHMDVTIMDFDTILSLLRLNRMYSALIHVYTIGLDDYISPFEILFEAVFSAVVTEPSGKRRVDNSQQSTLERYGYKAILYLRHCFKNRTFPQGDEIKPETRIDTLRPELLRFLKQKNYCMTTRAKNSEPLTGLKDTDYPYIRVLMMVDTKAFLDILSLIFDASGVKFIESIDHQDNIEAWHKQLDHQTSVSLIVDDDEQLEISNTQQDQNIACPDRMDFARIISLLIRPLEAYYTKLGKYDRVKAMKNAFYDFISKYLLKGSVRVPPELTMSVISRMASCSAQDEIIRLLQVLPRNAYVRDEVLSVIQSEGMTRAALVLHKSGVTDLVEGSCDSKRGSKHFKQVIDCYLKDNELSFRVRVFDYVKKECIGGSTFRTDGEENTVHDVLRNALCTKLCSLVNLDSVLSAQLVAEIYVEELDTILEALEGAEEGMVQFNFMHAIISGELTKLDAVAGPVLLANLSIGYHEKYLELMARFHPEMVYQHLITHDNYRPNECLQLCQKYEIADASAYLLERMGNLSSALQLMLQTLEGRMMALKRVVRGLSTSSTYTIPGRKVTQRNQMRKEISSARKHRDVKEVQSVRQILTVALDLCERNSGPSSSKNGHGSQLWFNVLDRLINAKGFLRLSKELPEHSEMMLNVLSDLLKMTMQRMVSNVALPDLVRKITTDHAGNRLGEFREMITTMLNTYVSELDVSSSAADVMNYDVHQLSMKKLNLQMCGTKVHHIAGNVMKEDENLAQKVQRKCILSINSVGNAVVVSTGESKTEARPDFDMESAVSKLRGKRQIKSLRKHKISGKRMKSKVIMTTMSDRLYANGQSSDAAFMSRSIGNLSQAEHYGRLQ